MTNVISGKVDNGSVVNVSLNFYSGMAGIKIISPGRYELSYFGAMSRNMIGAKIVVNSQPCSVVSAAPSRTAGMVTIVVAADEAV